MAEPIVSVDLYCRVSSDMQAEEGYSLQEQEARLRLYAEAQGWSVNACHVDPGFSGASLERPGIQNVIRDVEAKKVKKVVVYKLDRLSRDQLDVLYLIKKVFIFNGVDFVSMTENFDTGSPLGMAMIGILSVFAQLERDQIKERMMMGRIASAKEGNWRGGAGVPIGYRYLPKTATEKGRLVVDPYEAQIVRMIFELFLQGMTYHGIYDYCKGRYTTSYGSFGGGGSHLIPQMLSNRAYIGEIKYQGVWYPGKHEAIIDKEMFDRVQDRMAEYRATLAEHRRKPFKATHLLTGLLWCGECGARWFCHNCTYRTKAGEKRVYAVYTCYTKNAHAKQRRAERCSLPVWSCSDLEAVVWEQVLALRYEDMTAKANRDDEAIKAYEDKLKEIDVKLSRLVDLYTIGSLPLEAIQERSQELQDERSKLVGLCAVIRRRSTRLTDEELLSALSRARSVYESGTLEEQRALLCVLIKRIVVEQNKTITIEWNI